MSHCTCPSCGASLTITAGGQPRQPQPQPQRRPTAPNGPNTLAEALDYLLPLGKYRGERLGDVARRDPDWVRWAAGTLDRSAGRACTLVLGSLEAEGKGGSPPAATPGPPFDPTTDRRVQTEEAMADLAY